MRWMDGRIPLAGERGIEKFIVSLALSVSLTPTSHSFGYVLYSWLFGRSLGIDVYRYNTITTRWQILFIEIKAEKMSKKIQRL
jgi:hypothetical protein